MKTSQLEKIFVLFLVQKLIDVHKYTWKVLFLIYKYIFISYKKLKAIFRYYSNPFSCLQKHFEAFFLYIYGDWMFLQPQFGHDDDFFTHSLNFTISDKSSRYEYKDVRCSWSETLSLRNWISWNGWREGKMEKWIGSRNESSLTSYHRIDKVFAKDERMRKCGLRDKTKFCGFGRDIASVTIVLVCVEIRNICKWESDSLN